MPIRFLMVNAVYSQRLIDVYHPALGFGYIASSLRKEFGDKIVFKVIDRNLTESIKAFQPDIIGITSVTKNYNLAKEYAKIARQANIPVIIGGVHVTSLPQTLTSDMTIGVDCEGEDTIVELMSLFIESGRFETKSLYAIEGIMFWDNGELVQTNHRKLNKDLDSMPYPARELLDIRKHAHMLSSRGCPYNCAFCSTSSYTRHQVRYASAEYVADEIEQIYNRHKVTHITIYDDLFAMDTKRVIRIQEIMATKNLIGKFGMSINMRTNFITDDLAEILSQMNVGEVGLGTESGNQKTLDYLKGGGITVEDNARAVRILKKHHIIPYCSFVIGSPDESRGDIEDTIKFIKDNHVNYYAVSILVPYPGTRVWDYALSVGKVSNDMDWSSLDFYIKPDSVNLSKHLSIQELIDITAKMNAKRLRYLHFASIRLTVKHPIKYGKRLLGRITGYK